MFAAIYFEHDESAVVVNEKKIKRDKTRDGQEFTVKEKVTVPFKTRIIDDAGREKDGDVDYTGIILYFSKDRATVKRFLDQATLDHSGEKTVEELQKAVEEFNQSEHSAKRKHKKTSKLQSYEEDNFSKETQKTPTKRPVSNKEDDSPAKSTRSKKRSKNNVDDKSQKTEKVPSKGNMLAETQKLQALKYFEKKAITKSVTEHLEPEPEPSITISGTSQQRQSADSSHFQQDQPGSLMHPKQNQPESSSLHPHQNQAGSSSLYPQQNQPGSSLLHLQQNQPRSSVHPQQNQPGSSVYPQQNQPGSSVHPQQNQPRSSVHPQQNQPGSSSLLPQQNQPGSSSLHPHQNQPGSSSLHPHQNQPGSSSLNLQQNQPGSSMLPQQNQLLSASNIQGPEFSLNTAQQQPQLQQVLPHFSENEQESQEVNTRSCSDDLYSTLENTNYSSAIGQGYQTLWGPPPSTRCRDCEHNINEIETLKSSIQKLQDENLHLKETNERILSALTSIINNERMHIHPQAKHMSERQTRSRSPSPPSLPAADSENWMHCLSGSPRSAMPAKRAQSDSSVGPMVDNLESVEGYQQFFQPSAEKVKIVEGHGLYIEAIKLQAIKSKAKKEPKKVIRDLLAYFFEEEYLSRHSATGSKSAFKGLPSEILVPMKDYMMKQYHISDAAFNEAVNRKCRDLSKKFKPSKSS